MTDEEIRKLFDTAAKSQNQGTDSEKTAAAPQKTATSGEKTAVSPEKTAVSPSKTAVSPTKTAASPQKTGAAPSDDHVDIPVAQNTHKPGEQITVGGRIFEVVKLLGSGAEGDLYLVSDKKNVYALKLCHHGFKTNEKVLKALEKMKDRHVFIPKMVAYGPDYELMEYIPDGNAAAVSLKRNAEAITAIVVKIAMALDQMHKAGVLHKDVKPANILIRDPENYDSVLCDFGIADLLDQNGRSVSLQVRTPIYAAPEIYANDNTINLGGNVYAYLTAKADFYSLGMTALALWMGEGAFKSKEQELAMAKVQGRIAIPEDMPDPLAKIVRGLLIRKPEKRWDLEEIVLAIRGKDVPVEEDEIIEDLNIMYNAGQRKIANNPAELAQCMAEDIDLAAKYLYRGQIEKWLKPYTELAFEIHDITETRFQEDHKAGVYATIFFLNPTFPLSFVGESRTTGEQVKRDVYTLKDVGDFCNDADVDSDTAELICSEIFREWVRARSKEIAQKLPTSNSTSATYVLRVQTVDPLSDMNLCNKPDSPDYAMTGEGIGRLLNRAYTVFWNCFGGDLNALVDNWSDPKWGAWTKNLLTSVVANIAANYMAPEDYHYVTEFFDCKGHRFDSQRSWFVYCTDRNSDDYINKAGPKDDVYRAQTAWMKTIKGYGVEPVYDFVEKKNLKKEFSERGYQGYLAVQYHENPQANLKPMFAYEKLLKDYLEAVRDIDPDYVPAKRFDQARKEADKLLTDGKLKVHVLNARSIIQTVFTVVLAILPALLLLAMLIFSIVENPIVDVSNWRMENFMWIIGFLVSIVIWFTADSEGCLVPILGGAVAAFIITLLVKLLGGFILYLYALIVLGVLVWFCIQTIFNPSPFAKQARKFTRPGFDEKVLEPLYFAFSNDTYFDSSLNGAFNDDDIDNWRSDLKYKRKNILIFIGAVWFLFIFSSFIPKSERFDRISRPAVEKLFPPKPEDLLKVESLAPGAKGDDVKILQQFLLDGGYVKHKPDGDYGPGTKKGVMLFQKDHNLEQSGVADKNTVKMINKLAAEQAKADKDEVQ